MTHQTLDQRVASFLDGDLFAVAGASNERRKFGNKVLRCYMQAGREAYPVNPNEAEVEGLTAYPNLDALPRRPHGLSIITPPSITEGIVRSAVELGIRHIWIQPGAVHPGAVRMAAERGVNVIAGDACILVVLGFREHG